MLKKVRRAYECWRDGTLQSTVMTRTWPWRSRRRIAWWNRHEGSNRHVELKLGASVKIRLWLDSAFSKLVYTQQFEPNEREFLRAFLQPGDVYVDIGANIGLFTLLAADRVGPSGKVWSFEPGPGTFIRLRENLEVNRFDQVHAYQLAVSDTDGQMEFTHSDAGFDAWNSLAQPLVSGKSSQVTVQTVRWDTFAVKHDLVGRVTMMKIDVEGWESHVLTGAAEVLERADAPLLQVEFTEGAARSAGSSCTALYKQLESLGYRMYLFDCSTWSLVPDALREAYPETNALNLIATKNLAVAQSRLLQAR